MSALSRTLTAAAAALSLAGALGLSGCETAPPPWVYPGPYDGCPAGYHLAPGTGRCWLNGGGPPPAWVVPGPYGGCPPGYDLAPGGGRCWLNGAPPPTVPPGPGGGCPPGYHLGPQGGACWPN